MWAAPPPPADVLYPLPVPYAGVFDREPSSASSRRRAKCGHQRLLHLVVMALNFVYHDMAFVPQRLLQRPPNRAQSACLRYLGALVRTFGSDQEGVIPSGTGRRINILQARLGELSAQLVRLGSVADPYAWVPPGEPVPTTSSDEALQPYRSLCTERLLLRGRGHWDPEPFLSDELWLAFREPASLKLSRIPQPEEYPNVLKESWEETLALAKLWSRQGLLHLEPAVDAEPYCFTRIFNARKSSLQDRADRG